MSTSTGPKRNRKDKFSASVVNTITSQEQKAPVQEETVEETTTQVTVQPAAVVEPEKKPDTVIAATEEKKEETVTVTEAPAKVEKTEAPKETPKNTDNTQQQEFLRREEEILSYLAFTRSARGVQKSVYLDEDIHKYLLELSKKYNAKYSTVLNLVLRQHIGKR